MQKILGSFRSSFNILENIRVLGFFNISNSFLREKIQLVQLNSSCLKHTLKGKGGGNRKVEKELQNDLDLLNDEDIKFDDSEYDAIANSAMTVVRKNYSDQNIFIIQPYIKWGPKRKNIKPESQLKEAESLVRSLPSWSIVQSMIVPLESLDRKQLFGKGKLEEIKSLLKNNISSGKKITSVFISVGTISFNQKQFLQSEFQASIIDRYSVVIQILRLHATSAEAKLQVAMAELPYIWGQYKNDNQSTSRKQGFYLNDTQREMLRKREKKLKNELEKIRSQRALLRNKRIKKEFPIIAIVGYTNAGKTSLIKALTNEESIQPKNQLFATLDVTAHAGYLPCKLEVLYMDTVGFMSDIPTGLIESFVATLEDAMMADVILHVQDISNIDYLHQKSHVEETLNSLTVNYSEDIFSKKIINVGNKADLINELPQDLEKDMKIISSKTFTGIPDLLLEIESKVLTLTNRKRVTFRIKNGGEELAWLYKNSVVTKSIADPNNEEYLLLNVIITNANFEIFKHSLSQKKKIKREI